jgi:hopanoid C-3 methylase
LNLTRRDIPEPDAVIHEMIFLLTWISFFCIRYRPVQKTVHGYPLGHGTYLQEKRMKVLLIEPPVSRFDITTKLFLLPPPYHLEVLAGSITGDHDVHILDMRIDDDLATEVLSFLPDVIGCSSVAANSHLAKSVLMRAKELSPQAFTVVGGHHPSLMPQDFQESFIDAVVVGEGENTLLELVEALASGRNWRMISGMAYKLEDGGFRSNPSRDLMDLNDFPKPARHLTRLHREKQLYFRANWRPIDSTISSRGCPNKCTFCGLWKINHGKYRTRNPRQIVDELETISAPYVTFIDDNTLADIENTLAITDEIKRRGIKKRYELYGRVDTIVSHPRVVERWRDAGMELLLVGLEACDDNRLTEMRKRTTSDMNRRAIEICRANGVEIAAYLIVHPAFDREDFKRLSAYVEQNQLTHPVFTVLSPFPGTDLYDDMKEDFITEGFELLDFFHTVLPTSLPLDEFYDEFLGLYRRAYPFKEFIKSVAKGKAVLSPSMIAKNFRMRKRLASLRKDHDLVRRKGHAGQAL